jgi:cytochrome c biogenesis protein CcdA
MDHYALDTLSEIIQEVIGPLTFGCVFPIVITWLIVRLKINESKNRMQIVMAAIEKNAETDVEDLLKKMAPQKKLLKEKLLSKLLWGGIISLVGLSCIAVGLYLDIKGIGSAKDHAMQYWLGGSIFAIGIAFLVNYAVGKKFLAKEIEAEQNQLLKQA